MEMILVADLDLTLLNELHTYGAVRNLKDRRTDMYSVQRTEASPPMGTIPPGMQA